MQKVSIILPTKDEERSIEEVIRKCLSLEFEKEIIVVDNSSDKTPEIAEKLGCKVIRSVRGYGNACIEGLKNAGGDIVVILDADGSYDPNEIPKLITPILKGEAEIVLGSRFKGKIMPEAMQWHHRYIGNPLLTKITNLFFKTKLSDVHSGMRALKKEIIQKLDPVCSGMEFATEIVLKAAIKGLRIAEVPIDYYPRVGNSKLRSFRDGWRHLRLIFSASPNYTFLLPSSLFIIAGLAVILYVAILHPIRTHTLVFGSMLILLGIQTFFFGVSGKIYAKQIGFGVDDKFTEFFSRYSVIEKLILLGIAIFVFGSYQGFRVVASWLEKGYGSLSEFNSAVIALLLVVSGSQIIFSSFFHSIFLLKGGKEY